MDAIERDEKLNELKGLVEKQVCGSAAQLANSIEVSRATLFRLINHLKIREGGEIKYCKIKKHFFFEKK
jgi:hypothetical protein